MAARNDSRVVPQVSVCFRWTPVPKWWTAHGETRHAVCIMSSVSNTTRLRALIQSARDANGWTYDEIARRTGGRLSKSGVHQIATKQERTDLLPRADLEALADGLGLPFDAVRDAALEDAGLLVHKDAEIAPEAVVITEAMEGLTDSQRKQLMQMALELSRAFRQGS